MLRFLGKSLVLLMLGAMMITLVLPAGTSVRAQDGLSDEEKAILDRLEGAIENFTEYTSFTSYAVELESQEIALAMSGFEFSQTETTNREITATYIDVDGVENIHADVLVTSIAADGIEDTESAYTLEAEVRLVDGELYVMASYLDSEGAVNELPEGWVTVDETNLFQFIDLDISDLLDTDIAESTTGFDENDLFEDREQLEGLIESVTVDPIELEDGTPVDLITLTFSADGFTELMGETLDLGLGDDSGMEEMMNALFEGISFSVQIALDADDNVRQTNITIAINVEELDASFIPDVPEGMDVSLSITMEMVETTTYSDINADLQPVTAPE